MLNGNCKLVNYKEFNVKTNHKKGIAGGEEIDKLYNLGDTWDDAI